MLTTRDIRAIDSGPRQLTFDFDIITPEEKDKRIIASFREQISIHGHICLTEFVSFVEEKHGLSAYDILQSVFWAANELELIFISNDFIVSPCEAKKILLNSSPENIFLIDNLKVEDSVFNDALAFYQVLMPESFPDNVQDKQYRFARILRIVFKNWGMDMKALEIQARQTCFPGKQKIENHLRFLGNIIAHQDTASIINDAYNKRKELAEIKAWLQIISNFYKNHAKQWGMFLNLYYELSSYIEELKKMPEVYQDYKDFQNILYNSESWNMISEAENLFKNLDEHNKRIIKEKLLQRRTEAHAHINNIIKKVRLFLDNQKSDMDFRNQCLYPLQKGLRQVKKKGSVKAVNDLLTHLEDTAEHIMGSFTE